jgi:hypothetical protein
MVILIAGMPRAGSMWTYNIARECIRAAGHSPLPHEPPIIEKDALMEAVKNAHDKRRYYCIKTHEHVPLVFPVAKIICNYRDVRDAMVSYMKFTHCDFEYGLHIAGRMMSLTDHFFMAGPSRLLKIHFDEVSKSNNAALVGRISEFLGLDLPRKDIKNIHNKYTKARVRSLVNTLGKVDIDASGQLRAPGSDNRFISTRNRDGTYRAYDRKSGFQGRHITATRDAEWKIIFTEEQQKRLLDLTSDWLTRHGFPL